LDAGTGTGILAAYLGRLGLDVTTYERDPEFAEVARENVRVTGVAERVAVRTGDVTDDLDALVTDGPTPTRRREAGHGNDDGDGPIDGRDAFDVVTLDTADAPAVVGRGPDLLVPGGYVVAYTPFVEGTREVARRARSAGLVDVETRETIQRRMTFDDRGSRPSTAGVGHTGYLTFARRR
jgi:tRNA (adenine57-N1/adenine58-N1)-methyltransferase